MIVFVDVFDCTKLELFYQLRKQQHWSSVHLWCWIKFALRCLYLAEQRIHKCFCVVSRSLLAAVVKKNTSVCTTEPWQQHHWSSLHLWCFHPRFHRNGRFHPPCCRQPTLLKKPNQMMIQLDKELRGMILVSLFNE